jgi:peptidyl-dipeptidase Dcp
MVRTLLLASAALGIAMTPAVAAPAPKKAAAAGRATLAAPNPFAKPSTLPFQAPDFSKIKDTDYLPAILAGMAEQKREVAAISNNPAAPTFNNTLVALERSGALLERAQLAFLAVSGANTNDTIQATDTRTAPLLAQHRDYIYLNLKLFRRVETLYNQRDSLSLNAEQARLLKVQYDQFVKAGAKLEPAKQAELKKLNTKLSTLESKFTQTLLAAAKAGALHVTDKAALAGLSDDQIAAAAEAAKERKVEGYVLPLQNTTQQPALESLTNRATREALYNASITRASKGDANDTRNLITEIAQLRAKKAGLLGFPNYAAYILTDQMAKTPEAALGFVNQLAPAVAAKERAEAADIQKLIDAQGGGFKAQPWDWNIYAEQIRKQRYAIDSEALKNYFEFNTVLEKGVFYAANQLYGLTFSERKDLPTWNPDMRVFQVNDADGKELALFYIDPWKRDNKSGGAWMSNLVNQSTLRGTKPVVFNVENFTKPAPGKPALISWDDVTTMFHEFGHALHGMFAAQTYPTLSGTNVARDFVEFPSQFNENWALDPKVLPTYAVHYQTKQPIPQELVQKILKARTFNQGYELGEAVTAAKMDLDWHSLTSDAPRQNADEFQAKALANSGFDVADVPPRYFSPYFLHVWSNGYAAGYYAYAWTEMLDHDVFDWFKQHGGLTRENGQRFREMVLSRGNTLDYGEMYRAFTGHDPQVEPMLEFRGLTQEQAKRVRP